MKQRGRHAAQKLTGRPLTGDGVNHHSKPHQKDIEARFPTGAPMARQTKDIRESMK